jgi:hypothetical protein
MRPKLTLMLTVLTVVTTIALVTTGVEQVSAPRDCGSCIAFKKLTHEFEKAVIDAATIGDPNIIPGLLEQYNEDVRAMGLTPRG